MPKKGPANEITEPERLLWVRRLADMGWTRTELADAVGLGKGRVSDILNGKTKQTTLKAKFEQVLGVRPAKMPSDPIFLELVTIMRQLDAARRERLYERALALLDEQGRER